MVSNHGLSKPTLLTLLAFCLSIFLQVTASPLAVSSLEPQDLVKRYKGTPSEKEDPGGPETSDYSTDAEIAAAFTAPSGSFVFFSGISNSQAPYGFAQTLSPRGVILRNTFPDGFISRGKPPRSKQWFQNFLDRASGFFADQAVAAGKPVYLVGKFDGDVNSCSIWVRIELPTLMAGGIPITLVDYTNFANQKPYQAPVMDRRTPKGGASPQDYCFDWEGDQEDPADPDSTPGVGLGYYPGACVAHVVQVRAWVISHAHREIFYPSSSQKTRAPSFLFACIHGC